MVHSLVAELDDCRLASYFPPIEKAADAWIAEATDTLTQRFACAVFEERIQNLLARTPSMPLCAMKISAGLRSLSGEGDKMEHRPLSVEFKILKQRIVEFLEYLRSYHSDVVVELEKRITEDPKTPLTLWIEELKHLLSRAVDIDYTLIRAQVSRKDPSLFLTEWQTRLGDLENKFLSLARQKKEGLGAKGERLVEKFDETHTVVVSIHRQVKHIEAVVKGQEAACRILLEEGKALRG